jgi:hypothetical protein
MRTSQICPTCTTYVNSLCVIYNGTYLSNINASPLDTLDKILTNINSSVGAVNTSITTLNSSVTTLSGNVALKESSSNKSNDGTFNSGVPSATLFPTQSAVATYVAANTPTLDQVLIAGDISTIPLNIGNTLTTPTELSTIDSGTIILDSALSDTSTTYQSTGIVINNISNTDQMVINFNKNNQTIDFPSTSGTLALTSSIPPPGWELTGNSGTVSGTNFIGTTDAQDVVFKANNVEYFKLLVADQLLLLSKSLTSNSTSTSEIGVRSTASSTNGYVVINQNATDKGNVQISNGDGATKIKTLASAATRTVSFPNADGTIALEKYKVYTAFLSYDGTSTTTIVLQNGIGDGSGDGINDIAWAYTGVFFTATMTAGPFTNNKTAVFTSGVYFPTGTDSYCLIGLRNTDALVRIFSKRLSDGATGALPFTNQLIEIRVYL